MPAKRHPCPICGSSVRSSKKDFCSWPCYNRSRDPVVRFWSRVRKTDYCWLWTGFRDKNGYGLCGERRAIHEQRAHRIAWTYTHGRIAAGLWLLHRCDNPPCVRPEHLYLGTVRENVVDRDTRGHARVGEEHHDAKLTAAAVKDIRERYRLGDVSQVSLAAQYGVSQVAISAVIRRHTWRSV